MPRSTQYSSAECLEADWDILADNMDMALGDGGLLNEPLNMQHPGCGFEGLAPSLPIEDFFSQELISLGLQEPLPPQDLIDDLYVPDKFHNWPIKHQILSTSHCDGCRQESPPYFLLGGFCGLHRPNWVSSVKVQTSL
jgi:hypothetical protein